MQRSAIPPSRSIVIFGFKSVAELEKFRKDHILEDKVQDCYCAPKTNLLFVIFYDVRQAVSFRNDFKNKNLKILHTISKYEIPKKKDQQATEKNLQSTISLEFVDTQVEQGNPLLWKLLEKCGAIREIRENSKEKIVIEYYDQRLAVKAFSTLNELPINQGYVKCSWEWDLSFETRIEYLKITDALLRESLSGMPAPAKQSAPEPVQVKKLKTEDVFNKSSFTKLFDKFIAGNIEDIEKMFRFS
ncbi:hypothetical protein ENBRE01_1144 [Enteropsectra breve]|nr:hypothetical protein ENBRE01_1144 [Enteropsectra breve]